MSAKPRRQKAAVNRPRGGRQRAKPRTRSPASRPRNQSPVRARGRRVNQQMIDKMIAWREQGDSEADIARKLRCSTHTVSRHTKGVTRRLRHATDPRPLDLLRWGSTQIFALKDRLDLTVKELNVLVKALRKALAQLDEFTVSSLATNRALRVRWLLDEFLRRVAPQIRIMRLMARFELEVGPTETGAR